MSGEYFSSENNANQMYKEYGDSEQKLLQNLKENDKIQDIEDQLEIAESRCNTLKGQLDYMKTIYVNNKSDKVRKISNISTKKPDECYRGSQVSLDSFPGSEKGGIRSYSARQASNNIAVEFCRSPAQNINSILHGITSSVNRLSNLHLQMGEATKGKKILSEPTHITGVEIKSVRQSKYESQSQLKDESSKIKIPTKYIKPFHPRVKKSLLAVSERTSKVHSINIMAPLKLNTIKKNLSRRNAAKFARSLTRSNNLVEIYHNNAAKESDSDHSEQPKTKNGTKTTRTTTVPPLKLLDFPNESSSKTNMKCNTNRNKTGNTYVEPVVTRNKAGDQIADTFRSYQLPTIASKMKQVARCYFNAFNFKAIPFCPATSTSPSHNIGINLQQVMSLMKTKQPLHGISPTLAHNIGLAAERLNSSPGSMMVTSMTSRTTSAFTRSPSCPLSKQKVNFQQLQEMAKTIPEDSIEELENENQESPTIRTMIITGPSGDMEVTSKKEPVWAADSNTAQQRCTCMDISGADLQHIVNKYHLTQPPNSMHTDGSHPRVTKLRTNLTKKQIKPVKMSLVTKHNGVLKSYNTGNNFKEVIVEEENKTPLQGKEKTLRGVLANLHKEFDVMNRRYEELSKTSDNVKEENIKELEKLENDLNSKEEEITMVMELYKEVLALKQQVQTLKQKSSQSSINPMPKFSEYHNPKAAFHLTKLLKQIQHYQQYYKKDSKTY